MQLVTREPQEQRRRHILQGRNTVRCAYLASSFWIISFVDSSEAASSGVRPALRGRGGGMSEPREAHP